MGPVFIIRELNKENGEYDAFITTGGIQEVKPPKPMPNNGPGGLHAPPPPPPLQHHQQKPMVAVKDDEDSEYFGVLVTPDTVKQLDYQPATAINVSLSVLLVAASSRMPWLLVLRRRNYPQLFEPQLYHQQQPAPVTSAAAVPPGIPGMQIPQRRRYYADRQKRGLYLSPRTEEEERFPLLFERELLSTMCYNFVRDYASSGGMPALPIALSEPADRPGEVRGEPEVFIDANAYAAAAAATAAGAERAEPLSAPQQDGEQELKMTVPIRVSSTWAEKCLLL